MGSAADASEALVEVQPRRASRSSALVGTLTRGSTTRMAASASLLVALAILLIGTATLPQGLAPPSPSSSMAYRALVASAVLAFTGIWLAVAVCRYIWPSQRPHDMG